MTEWQAAVDRLARDPRPAAIEVENGRVGNRRGDFRILNTPALLAMIARRALVPVPG